MDDSIVEILLIEDNRRDADLTIRTLEKHNLSNQIKWVKDGEEALNYLQGKGEYEHRDSSHLPEVVFLDLKMPKVDGLEVLKTIREHKDLKHLPVVVLTSSQEEKDIVRSYKFNVNSYIVKPVDFEKFGEAIKDIGFYWLVLNKHPNSSH